MIAKMAYSSYLDEYQSGRYSDQACIGFGESCLQLNELDDAMATFQKLSAEEGPLYKASKFYLGQCYERKNQKEKAIQEYTSLALIDDLEQTKDEYPFKAYERLLSLNGSIPVRGITHYPVLFKNREIWVKGKVKPLNKEDFSDAVWDLILKLYKPDTYRYVFLDNSYEDGIVFLAKEKQSSTVDQNIPLKVKAMVYLGKFVYLEDITLTRETS